LASKSYSTPNAHQTLTQIVQDQKLFKSLFFIRKRPKNKILLADYCSSATSRPVSGGLIH
jgi:hypothetical protein